MFRSMFHADDSPWPGPNEVIRVDASVEDNILSLEQDDPGTSEFEFYAD